MSEKNCVECGQTIPEDRIKLAPRTVTCSRGCGDDHSRTLRREWARKERARVRAAMAEGMK